MSAVQWDRHVKSEDKDFHETLTLVRLLTCPDGYEVGSLGIEISSGPYVGFIFSIDGEDEIDQPSTWEFADEKDISEELAEEIEMDWSGEWRGTVSDPMTRLGFKPGKPNKPKPFVWTVEIEIDPMWVADGFDLTDERAQDIFEHALPYARSTEVRATVLTRPSDESIAKEQGYPDVEAWRASNERRRVGP